MTYAAADRTESARSRAALLLMRLAGAASAIVLVATTSGCGASAPDTGTEISDVHLNAIRDAIDELEYKKVTVPGETKDIISPSSFSISDPENPLVEDLLIVHRLDSLEISPADPVKVTGIVYRGFDVAEVEKETGIALDAALHRQWQGDSYIVASQIDKQ